MTQNQKNEMCAHIRRHGEQLQRIFNLSGDPVKLCKQLRRIETKTNRAAEDCCNGGIDGEQWEIHHNAAIESLVKILGESARPVIHINGDPRGYALKIDDEAMRVNNWTLYRDMGGYGILAPDFTPSDERN